MDELIEVIRVIRAMRADLQIQPASRVPIFVKTSARSGDDGWSGRMRAHETYVKRLALVDTLTVGDTVTRPAQSVAAVLSHAEVYLALEGVVDVTRERARLQKEYDDVTRRLELLEGRLNDAAFRSRAPGQIVEQEEARRTEFRARAKRLAALLESLAS